MNFSSHWKEPLNEFVTQEKKGINRRRLLRNLKKKYKMNQSEFTEFVRRVESLL